MIFKPCQTLFDFFRQTQDSEELVAAAPVAAAVAAVTSSQPEPAAATAVDKEEEEEEEDIPEYSQSQKDKVGLVFLLFFLIF